MALASYGTVLNADPSLPMALTTELCVTNCTQQCLSREPLLATALSTLHVTAREFQKTVSMYWQQQILRRH